MPTKAVQSIDKEAFLLDIERKLGADHSDRLPKLSMKGVSAANGESIVKNGFALSENGKKTGKQSKHFVCTSCHNVVKEDPDLKSNDAQARLDYASSNGLPYLQGTALYGAVNRSTFYNGDYYKKYGKLIEPAKNDIRGAIQLCATQCAQGRALKEWEIESVLAYLHTIGIKIKDIKLSNEETSQIEKALSENNKDEHSKALALLQNTYLHKSDATFVPPPDNRKKGNGLVGKIDNGLKLYKSSCLHCHYQQRYSYLHLDETNMSIKYLNKHMRTYHRQSVYQVTRWGVPVYNGKESYMPHYTLEKMSEQQLADLTAFVASK